MAQDSTRYGTIFSPGLFDGQVALVTGGGTGIGRASAHELAALGATVVVAARREEPLIQTVGEIRGVGGNASWTTLNIREAEEVEAVIGDVVEEHGRLDLLVNNAGGQFPAPSEQISPNGWRTVIDLNLNGTFLVTRAAYTTWMAEHGGVICNVIADMWRGFPYMAHTGAARAGVDNLTKSLAIEWGRSGVRINAVAPGTIYSSGMDTYDESFRTHAARRASKIPVGRVGTESETAAAITFLLSPAAAFITGATLRVDGGASLEKAAMVPLEAHTAIPPYNGFHLAREIPEAWVDDGEPDA
ncbi:SDR family oxidoreductase [Euzebya tangerina]|uniref:SDR family oxidoreductase n=1 Tax=Euzebya tangerina TaxID=591198 RepID=UPI000E30B9F7|nr:SDR family oxidoreductase [Euzebya tangerina]